MYVCMVVYVCMVGYSTMAMGMEATMTTTVKESASSNDVTVVLQRDLSVCMYEYECMYEYVCMCGGLTGRS